MIKTLRAFGFEPKHESIEDVIRVSKLFQGVKDECHRDDTEEHRYLGHGTHNYPKFSIFFGEEGMGEVNWETYRYEIEVVRQEDIFSPEQIMFGIRRSLKGTAGDKVRRLGPGVTIRHVLERLESAYATVETKESIMKKFYTILKQVLHAGLRKHISVYQCNKIQGYDELKRDLRKLESKVKVESQESRKPCKPTVLTDKKEETVKH